MPAAQIAQEANWPTPAGSAMGLLTALVTGQPVSVPHQVDS